MIHRTVHLLVVEDDAVDLMAIRRGFDSLRLANPVRIAHDGIEALEWLRGENGREKLPRPHLILLDLQMPRMNGLEFLAALRADPALADSVVFVLTTSKFDEDITAAYRHHIAGYIVKGTLADEFLGVVNLLEAYWRIVELPA